MSNKIESDFGYIEYRAPDVPEALELMGAIDMSKEEIAEIKLAKAENREAQVNVLKRTSKAMRHLGPFCVKIELETNEGVKVTEYSEALKHLEFFMLLMEFSGEMLGYLDIDAKKKPLSKPSASASPKKALPSKTSKD